MLAHRIPYPPNKGDKVRSYHLLKHLVAPGHQDKVETSFGQTPCERSSDAVGGPGH